MKADFQSRSEYHRKNEGKGSNLEGQLENREKKIEKLTDILSQKDDILRQIEEKLRLVGGEGLAANLYNAIKGDMVDELLAKYINMTQCPVPIKRLGNGYYLFGSKKIFAKIMNGKLVIRVGGGFMVIEEFIATYAEQEMKKMQNMEAAGRSMDEDEFGALSGKNKGYSSNRRSPRSGGGSAGGFASGSPRHDNFAKRSSELHK